MLVLRPTKRWSDTIAVAGPWGDYPDVGKCHISCDTRVSASSWQLLALAWGVDVYCVGWG